MFGGEKYQKIENYGSDKGIKIMSGVTYASYNEILTQSIETPFTVDIIKVISTYQQLSLPLTYIFTEKRKDTNIKKYPFSGGASWSMIDETRIMQRIELENLNGYAEVHEIKKISDETTFDFMVLPKTIIIIKIYPVF